MNKRSLLSALCVLALACLGLFASNIVRAVHFAENHHGWCEDHGAIEHTLTESGNALHVSESRTGAESACTDTEPSAPERPHEQCDWSESWWAPVPPDTVWETQTPLPADRLCSHRLRLAVARKLPALLTAPKHSPPDIWA